MVFNFITNFLRIIDYQGVQIAKFANHGEHLARILQIWAQKQDGEVCSANTSYCEIDIYNLLLATLLQKMMWNIIIALRYVWLNVLIIE